MAKHREPDWTPYLRGSKRHDGDTADALRAAGNLPDNPVTPEMREEALAVLAADLCLPVDVLRAHIAKLAAER